MRAATAAPVEGRLVDEGGGIDNSGEVDASPFSNTLVTLTSGIINVGLGVFNPSMSSSSEAFGDIAGTSRTVEDVFIIYANRL